MNGHFILPRNQLCTLRSRYARGVIPAGNSALKPDNWDDSFEVGF